MTVESLAKLSHCTCISQSIKILKRVLLIYDDYSKRTNNLGYNLWQYWSFIQNSFLLAVEKSICLINLAVPPSVPPSTLFVLLVSFPMGSSKLIHFKMEKYGTISHKCFLNFSSPTCSSDFHRVLSWLQMHYPE